MMKRFLSFAVFVVLAVLAVEASNTPRAAVPQEYLQNADIVVLDDVEKVKYNPDGTYVSHAQMRVLVLTERGRKSQTTQTMRYNRRYGKAKFDEISIERPDGTVDRIDISKSVKDTTDNSSMRSNIVDPHDRKLVCNVPGIKIGDVVELKCTRKTFKSRVENEFADCFVIEGTSPSVRAYYEVTAPSSNPIKKIKVRNPIGNVIETRKELADGSMVHIFAATNTPRMFPEPGMPDTWTQCQHILVSTVGDWKDFSRWYWQLSLPHIEKTTPAMTNMALKLSNPIDIFKFVSQEIRYMGLTMEDKSPGYAPHDVNITFDNKYGVCRDKAALLVAMLRIAGHKAYPVLINVGAKLDSAVPLPFFNHAIVALEKNDGTLQLMDPTNENTKDPMPSYLCNLSYLVARPEGDDLRVSSVPDPKKNSVSAKTRARLNKHSEMFVVSDVSFLGINDTVYRGAFARFSKQELTTLFFERRLKKLSPSAELIDYNIEPKDIRDTSKPLKLTLTAKVPGMTIKGGKYLEVQLPLITRGIGILGVLIDGNTSLKNRKYPLVIDTTAQVSEDLEIELGDVAESVVSLPPEGKLGEGFVYERSAKVSDGKLSVKRVLTLDAMEYSVEQYGKLKKSLEGFEQAERRKCIFALNVNENADTRLLSMKSDVFTNGDYEWVETNEFVREVLTYNGLKSSSEIKINYHPSITELEVLSASVSNKNGKVFKVSPAEINVMDAPWAAAAPRYEAGKTLVVNLPGVEKGSYITFKVAKKTKNSPIPFFRTWYFDSFEPVGTMMLNVDLKKVEITKPKRLKEERYLPTGQIWRDGFTLYKSNWPKIVEKLKVMTIVAANSSVKGSIEDIRNFMAQNVRVIGPAEYAMAMEKHLTDPQRVIEEKYASRLDYVRTMVSLLKGSGYDARVVFAEDVNGISQDERKFNKELHANVRNYSRALCMVKTSIGNVFIGTENEYTPIGATLADGAEYLDPHDGSFGIVKSIDGFGESNTVKIEYDLSENGDAVVTSHETISGASVGVFRKQFAEMLPEDRSRHYLKILDDFSAGAEAVTKLETDVKGYPATMSYKCRVPSVASVDAGIMSLNIPQMDVLLPQISTGVRESPVLIPATDDEEQFVIVRFPYGYAKVDHLPADIRIDYPTGGEWFSVSSTNVIENGRLKVVIRRSVKKRHSIVMAADYAQIIAAWRDKLLAVSQNTISALSENPVVYGIDGRRGEWKRTSLGALIKGWNLDESKVPKYTLPDPLFANDGGKVDEEKWRQVRRGEILDKLSVGEYGYVLPKPAEFTHKVISEKNDALGNLATRREILMRFKGKTGKALTATMLLYIPNGVKNPVPIFLGLNFRGNHATTCENDVNIYKVDFTASEKAMKSKKFLTLKKGYERGSAASRWPYEEIVKRGYAIATVCYHEFYPDFMGSGQDSALALFLGEEEVNGPQIGYTPIGAWAWGLSRMLDVASGDARIDATRAAVIGHSRLGKVALWAGAVDERFGLVCPNNSGCGGVALHKRKFGENIEAHLTHRDNDQDAFWFTEAFAEAWGKEENLSFDQHEAVSLIAPRAIAVGVATKDLYADPKGEYESLVAAKDVWGVLGIKVSLPKEMPKPNAQVIGPISFHVREGKHDITSHDWNCYMNAADILWRAK